MSQIYILKASVYQQLVKHCQDCLPNEACGLIAGPDKWHGTRLFPITNVKPSPTSYRMDGKEVVAAFKKMEEENLQFNAAYHSHPISPARPSPTDIKEAYFTGPYLILSFRHQEPELKGFFIHEGIVEEIPVKIANTSD
ncbi:MAG: M67 family metallopeptidase [Firmicutes bacterium]|nr:M67 family metallopeptidase [Bacillota bacterium]